MGTPGEPGEVVVMGSVAAPHGVHGAFKVRTHSEDPAALLRYPSWWMRPARGGAWRAVEVAGGRVQGGILVAQLVGVQTREAAQALKGSDVGLARTSLPAASPGEIYRSDLVGMTVVGAGGIVLGSVAAVEDYGAHPLLRVTRPDGTGHSRLVPYAPAIVKGVDVAGRRIEVDWAEDY